MLGFRDSLCLLCLSFWSFFVYVDGSIGTIGLPPAAYNAARGQIAIASSFFDYQTNPQFQYKYKPGNAIDGMIMQTSWWSSGNIGEEVFWQLNFSKPIAQVHKLIIRWHGYQSARTFNIRTSHNGERWLTRFRAINMSMEWDRTDIFEGMSSQRIDFIRIEMRELNHCESLYECASTPAKRDLNEKLPKVPDLPEIYGIREVEVWTDALKSESTRREIFVFSWVLIYFLSLSYASYTFFLFLIFHLTKGIKRNHENIESELCS